MIDFVLFWVDGNDPEWQKEKTKYDVNISQQANGANRFRDWELLRYWFRGVEKFAPWVNRVYFVTCGHYPKWLNLANPKLKFVKHDEFIPHEYLPTFSSHPIELNIHRLPGLSDHFVLFNDDLLILKPLREQDFFKGERPRDVFIQSFFAPVKGEEMMCAISYNDLEVINHYYDKRIAIKQNPFNYFSPLYGKKLLENIYAFPLKLTGLASLHSAASYNKSTFEKLWKRDFDILDRTCRHKFRSREDVNQWLFAWDQVMRGEFVPMNPKRRQYYIVGNNKAISTIQNQKCDIICLNDGDLSIDFEKEKEKLKEAFEQILPEKSSFEI